MEVLRAVHVRVLCTQEVLRLEPSMSKAVEMLVKKEEDEPAQINPPCMNERMRKRWSFMNQKLPFFFLLNGITLKHMFVSCKL